MDICTQAFCGEGAEEEGEEQSQQVPHSTWSATWGLISHP